ncbi:MAG: hypothetical protein KAR13_07055 [Desulfobulbaceae bacterium]|nr:hypothetical protein [Desulfobulbaceae bacterium]
MSKSISEFVSQALFELADQYQIPKSFIPQLTALIEKYPNMEIRGKKTELREDLMKVIENLKDQGLLS